MPFVDVPMRDRYGLHPRAALRIQQTVGGKRVKATIQRADGSGGAADASSLISLVSAGIGPNELVRVTVDGDDAEPVLAALRDLIEAGVCHP